MVYSKCQQKHIYSFPQHNIEYNVRYRRRCTVALTLLTPNPKICLKSPERAEDKAEAHHPRKKADTTHENHPGTKTNFTTRTCRVQPSPDIIRLLKDLGYA